MAKAVPESLTSRIEVRPAGPDSWEAIVEILGENGDQGCWCQAWRGVEVKGEARPDALRRQLRSDPVPPGYLAFLDGVPVGWCGVGVRTRIPRLVKGKTIPAIDDLPVWSIGCFKIRGGHRRRGVATALLDAVVTAARASGAPGVEAYPVDPAGGRVDTTMGYVGLASMFDKAGFRRVMDTNAKSAGLTRILVRLDLPR